MIEVRLSDQEIQHAAVFGAMRRAKAIIKGRKARYGYAEEDPWRKDIEACGAEMAAAKACNRYYVAAVGSLDYDGDVGQGFQVRSSNRPDARLIVHPEDNDDHYFVLVINEFPTYKVIGYTQARRVKRQEFWVDPGTGRPAYFVPQSALTPLPK